MKTKTRANGQRRNLRGCRDGREDQVRVDALEQALTAGHSFRSACQLADIGETSFFRWMREGEVAPEGTLARHFWQRVKKASVAAVHRNLLIIQSAARKNWQAAAWFLERRYPEDYGRKLQAEITGKGGGPIQQAVQTDQLQARDLSTPTLRELRDALTRAGNG